MSSVCSSSDRCESAGPAPHASDWRSIAQSLGSFFEEAPLAPGEDWQVYLSLRDALLDAVSPADVLELIWARDAADVEWELRRLRLVKTAAVASNKVEILADLLQKKRTYGPARKATLRLAEAFFTGDPQARVEVAQRLQENGRRMEDLAPRAYAANRLSLRPVEDLITRTERRRDKLLNEVERRRKSLAQRLRWAAKPIKEDEEPHSRLVTDQVGAGEDEQPSWTFDPSRVDWTVSWDEWSLKPEIIEAGRSRAAEMEAALCLQETTEQDQPHASAPPAGGATQDRRRDFASAPARGTLEDERLQPRSSAAHGDERLRQSPAPHPRERIRQGRG